MKRVLVIKHGSLGDIVFSLPVMHSIKACYSNTSIDLLTEKKYFNFLSKVNYFDSLIEDNRPNNIIITISFFDANKIPLLRSYFGYFGYFASFDLISCNFLHSCHNMVKLYVFEKY